jgi:cytidylate kinase
VSYDERKFERGYIDSNRANSPLVKAEGAVEIDNSNLNREEQFDMVLINGVVKKSIIFCRSHFLIVCTA